MKLYINGKQVAHKVTYDDFLSTIRPSIPKEIFINWSDTHYIEWRRKFYKNAALMRKNYKMWVNSQPKRVKKQLLKKRLKK